MEILVHPFQNIWEILCFKFQRLNATKIVNGIDELELEGYKGRSL